MTNAAKTVKTTCPYCGVGCGLLVDAQGGVTGDPDHPSNFGRLCSKGAALGETLGLEGRLLAPQVDGKPASWDTALDQVAAKFTAAIRDFGPDSVAFYVSGQLLTEDYYVANKLMKGFIGSANIDTNSRLCMASTVAGHKRAFGSDTVPGTYADLEQADVIVLTGSNLAWCHPVLFQRILAAKSARPEIKIITIDPRRTATSDASDLHLAIAPDADTALFNSLLAEIDARGAVDTSYVAAHVLGFETTLAEARACNPGLTGLSAQELETFHDLWIGAEKVVTVFSQGVNQSVGGADKVNAILNCHLATGRIGRPGMGPFSVTGQPNAMGGREVGGLANMLVCHLDIKNPAHRSGVQNFWHSPTLCTQPGLKAVDLFDACAAGKIKALWIMATNPAVSMPDADAVARAISQVDFTVVSDVMSNTDTVDLADITLPATTWGEKTGTVTNSERRISAQRAFLLAPGETRPDWKIICDVATRMGWGAAFSFGSPAEIFREYAALSSVAADLGSDFDVGVLATMTNDQYTAFEPVQWPVSKANGPERRLFGDGRFNHTDGKARMVPVRALDTATAPGAFRLNTGRIRDQWHTMTRSGKSPRLSQHDPEPFAQIHPEDAQGLGIKPDALVEVTAPNGHQKSRAIVRAVLTDGIPRGSLFVPMHWSGTNASHGRINSATTSTTDPFSGQPALKGASVRLRRFTALWHGFAASVAPLPTQGDYAAVARTDTGWSGEFAGLSQPANWESHARLMLNLASGSVSMMFDPAQAIVRVAIHHGETLSGMVFAAPAHVEITRHVATSLIGTKTPALTALAGLPAADQPDPGHIICACFNVGSNTILGAIAAGATSVVAVGACTGAGTNCGACKPELMALIDSTQMRTAAE